MTDDILKGNFKVKNIVKNENTETEAQSFKEKFKAAALHSIGGSMVFVEKDRLYWDEDESTDELSETEKN